MKYILLLAVFFGSLWAEQQTYTQSASQTIGSNQSVNEVRPIALLEAKRLALEQAGTYVESITVSEDFEITKDEVLSLTAGLVQTKVLDEKIDSVSSVLRFTITIQTVIEMADLDERIEELKKNEEAELELIESNKALRDQNNELEQELLALKARLEQAGSKEEAKQIQQKANQGVLKKAQASEEVDKARTLINKSKRDPSKLAEAEQALEKASELDPTLATVDYCKQEVASKRKSSILVQIKLLESTLRKNPKLHVARHKLARAYFIAYKRSKKADKKQEYWNQAYKNINTYIDYNKKNHRGYFTLYQFYKVMGQMNKANEILKRCLSNLSNSKKSKGIRKRINKYLGNAKVEVAQPKGNGKKPVVKTRDARAIQKAVRFFKKGKTEDALKTLQMSINGKQKAMQKNPKNLKLYYDLARLFSTQGLFHRTSKQWNFASVSYDKAVNFWSRKGKLDPEEKSFFVDDLFFLALVHEKMTLKQGNKNGSEKVLGILQKAVSFGLTKQRVNKNPILKKYAYKLGF